MPSKKHQSPENSKRLREMAARLIEGVESDVRRELFGILRTEFSLHPLEADWNTSAEAILEAIQRSSSLTQRGVRGVLAEASFVASVLPKLRALGFEDVTPAGDIPYDVALRDAKGTVRIQIKLQRSRDGRPMHGTDAPRRLGISEECFVVETQKTRGGMKAGAATRPYRFGEFDILGVSMYPSTKQWDTFLFTVARWLLPDGVDAAQIHTFQPVPPASNEAWTDDLARCIDAFRSGEQRQVRKQP